MDGQAHRRRAIPGEFALCLTHDVDRPFKTYQAVYDAIRNRSPGELGALRPGVNPYWQFGTIMDLEVEFGVRSTFYVLNEPSLFAYEPTAWVRPANWIEHFGRYDPTNPRIEAVLRRLADGGWEVGLHASRLAATDRERLAAEKETLESVLDAPVAGVRHHHLELGTDTWDHHREVGFAYDASLGDVGSPGFQHGYGLHYPDGGSFPVFPLTAMEIGLPDPDTAPTAARAEVDNLLAEAARNDAVMTVLWHPRYFSEDEFPGYRDLYRFLLRRATAMNAWIGPPRDALAHLEGSESGSRARITAGGERDGR